MPKSKRDKIVHLTKVKKKNKDHKEDLIKQLEELVTKFKLIYIFDFDQAKSDRVMALRMCLKEHGKIFAGRNSLVKLTLKTMSTKTKKNFDELAEQVSGHKGLLFTDMESNELLELLGEKQPEFCKKLVGYSKLAPGPANRIKFMSI